MAEQKGSCGLKSGGLAASGSIAIAAWFIACQPTENNCDCAANVSVNFYGFGWAVFRAGTALHATVFIFYFRLVGLNNKNSVRTNFCTFSAANTFVS